MIITTRSEVAGHEIIEDLNVVLSIVISGVFKGKEFIAAITDAIGGRSTTLEKTVYKDAYKAKQEMEEEAAMQGADAIVDFTIRDSHIPYKGEGHMIAVLIYGTAVKLRPIDGHQKNAN
jgi:uncharacterized protein YbjQ (UPF0145 family)